GVYAPTEGRICLGGRDVHGLPANRICEYGAARTFQNIRLFGSLSVAENVKSAQHLHSRSGWMAAVLRTPSYHADEAAIAARTAGVRGLRRLSHGGATPARRLPYGDQRRLEIARALATQPRLLLLDEPAAGMNPQVSDDLMALIRRIRVDFKLT